MGEVVTMFCFEYWSDNHICIYKESDDYLKLLDRFMARLEILKESCSSQDKDLYLVKLNNSIDDDEIIAEFHKEGTK